MGNVCTICSNENIKKINAAIVKGTKLNLISSNLEISLGSASGPKDAPFLLSKV